MDTGPQDPDDMERSNGDQRSAGSGKKGGGEDRGKGKCFWREVRASAPQLKPAPAALATAGNIDVSLRSGGRDLRATGSYPAPFGRRVSELHMQWKAP